MMGPNSSESSSECCLLKVSTIPHFSHVFDKVIDECRDFSIVPVGPGSFASRKSGRHRLDESSESRPQAMLNRKLRYRIDTNHMYRSYTIYSSAVPHSCLIFKLRCQQNQHVASNSHICFEYSLLNRALQCSILYGSVQSKYNCPAPVSNIDCCGLSPRTGGSW
jgi:hypothetical protein